MTRTRKHVAVLSSVRRLVKGHSHSGPHTPNVTGVFPLTEAPTLSALPSVLLLLQGTTFSLSPVSIPFRPFRLRGTRTSRSTPPLPGFQSDLLPRRTTSRSPRWSLVSLRSYPVSLYLYQNLFFYTYERDSGSGSTPLRGKTDSCPFPVITVLGHSTVYGHPLSSGRVLVCTKRIESSLVSPRETLGGVTTDDPPRLLLSRERSKEKYIQQRAETPVRQLRGLSPPVLPLLAPVFRGQVVVKVSVSRADVRGTRPPNQSQDKDPLPCDRRPPIDHSTFTSTDPVNPLRLSGPSLLSPYVLPQLPLLFFLSVHGSKSLDWSDCQYSSTTVPTKGPKTRLPAPPVWTGLYPRFLPPGTTSTPPTVHPGSVCPLSDRCRVIVWSLVEVRTTRRVEFNFSVSSHRDPL